MKRNFTTKNSMVSTIKLVCSQLIDSKCHLEFEETQETSHPQSTESVKIWIAGMLLQWQLLNVLQGNECFDLKKDIKISFYSDGKLKYRLRQQIVKDRYLTDMKGFKFFNNEWAFPLRAKSPVSKEHFYILAPYHSLKIIPPEPPKMSNQAGSSVNWKRLLNTIEYYEVEKKKYGTPIIYTGMID